MLHRQVVTMMPPGNRWDRTKVHVLNRVVWTMMTMPKRQVMMMAPLLIRWAFTMMPLGIGGT